MARILLVEDEVIIALGSSFILEEEGHSVEIAGNGKAGLEKALADPPDLIIADYMMPTMDGLAMITELRNRGSRVPIVLATSILEQNLSPLPEGVHYDAYLGKPYRDRELTALIRKLLG